MAEDMHLGITEGSDEQYTLNSGETLTNERLWLGNWGTGKFYNNGGTHNVGPELFHMASTVNGYGLLVKIQMVVSKKLFAGMQRQPR